MKFIVACVILGLEAMNKKGFMHKDIKPCNLLFDERGYVKFVILDWLNPLSLV